MIELIKVVPCFPESLSDWSLTVINRLLVLGAGGHGCVVAETAIRSGAWSDVVHLDDVLDRPQLDIGTRVLGSISGIEKMLVADDRFVVGVGDNAVRLRLFEELKNRSNATSVIALEAIVSRTVSVGDGCVIMSGAHVNAGVVLGDACILNTASIIEHGVTLDPGVHVGPGAILGGDVKVGARSFIGMGAKVLPGVSLGADVVLGAGAVAVSDLTDAGTYAGVPATPLRLQ